MSRLATTVRARAAQLLAAVAACAVLVLVAPPAGAQSAQGPIARRVLAVTGEGTVRAKPDQAALSAGVVSEADSAAAALAQNTDAMNQLFAVLKRLGIPDTKIQTSHFAVAPQYPPYKPDSAAPHAITSYRVSNELDVTLDDLSKLGAALDALLKAGSNQLSNVSFAIADPKPLLERARREAVADATAKAKTLAEAAGVTLGPILSITEGDGAGPQPVVMEARALSAQVVPVAPGETSVRISVSITWAVE